MKYELTLLPTQRKFLFAPQKFPAFIGGFGSGKSRVIVELALRLSRINAGCPGMVVSPSYRMLYDPTIITFIETLEERGIPYHHQKSLNIMNLPWGSVYLRSADEPSMLRGPSLSFFAIDEASMCSDQAWKILLGRLRHPKAKILKGALSTTPEGLDWVYNEFIEKADDRPNYKLFQASSRENIFLPESYVADLEQSYDENLARAYISGEFVDMTSGRAYHEFGNHNIREIEFNPSYPLELTADFNVSPMCWLIFQHYNHQLFFIDEIVIKDNASTEMAISKFVDLYKKLSANKEVGVYGDASGKARKTAGDSDYIIISEFLKSNGISYTGYVPASNPNVRDRLNSVNSVLQNRGDETRCFIDPRCEALVKDLRLVSLTRGGDIDKRRRELSHASDAFGYSVVQIMPIKKYRAPQKIIQTTW